MTSDRIADVWGERTLTLPVHSWPVRVDMHLDGGLTRRRY